MVCEHHLQLILQEVILGTTEYVSIQLDATRKNVFSSSDNSPPHQTMEALLRQTEYLRLRCTVRWPDEQLRRHDQGGDVVVHGEAAHQQGKLQHKSCDIGKEQ